MSINKDQLILFVCSAVFFIANIDITITNVALPSMAKSFSVDLMAMNNIVIGFLVAYAVSIPLVEFAVDRFGLKNILLASCLFFALSSFFCANSDTLTQLNYYRILQGISAGFFTPIARSVVVKISPVDKLAVNLSNVHTLGMLGQAIGPFVGAYIISFTSWRYIFFLNIPLCLVVMIICAISFEQNIFNKKTIYQLDAIGYLIISSLIVSLFLVLNNFEHNIYWSFNVKLEGFVLLVSCIIFLSYLKFFRGKQILDYRLIASNHEFRNSLYISFIARQFTGCLQFFIVIFFSSLYYADSTLGYLLLCYGLGIWLSKSIVKYLFTLVEINKLIRYTLILIFILNAILFQTILQLHNIFVSFVSISILGVVISVFHSAINVYALGSVKKSDSIAASSLVSILMYISQSSSIVIFSIIVFGINKFHTIMHIQYQIAEFVLSFVLIVACIVSRQFIRNMTMKKYT